MIIVIKYSLFGYSSLKIKLELFRLELHKPGSNTRNGPTYGPTDATATPSSLASLKSRNRII